MVRLRPWIILAFALGALSACQKPEGQQKDFLIGFSQCCSDPWRDVMNGEIQRELSFHPELQLEARTAGANSETQIEQIQQLMEMDIDLLIVAPNELEPLTPLIEEIFAAQIPVIFIDRKAQSEQYTAYVGADNYEIGHTAAEYIANQFNGQGEVIELQMAMSISPAIERHQGFVDGLEKYPDLTLAAQASMGWDNDQIEAKVPPLIQAHPNANIIFAQSDLIAMRTKELLNRIGKGDDIFVVGVDGIPGPGQGIEAVESGQINASFLYPTGGVEAIQLALTILHGMPFQKMNLLQTTVIDPSNARILHAQMKKQVTLQEGIDQQTAHIESLYHIYTDQRILILVLGASLLVSVVLGGFLWKSLKEKEKINANLASKNQEVIEQKQQVELMSEEIQEVSRAKIEFFTHISHEFRTPLTLILGFAGDLLNSHSLKREISQQVQLISENAQRLLRLVNQLMDFRKIEEGKLRLQVSEQDLIAFLRHAMKSYHLIAQKQHIKFELLTNRPKIYGWFDRHMLDKVIFNLLSNAFKFTPEGGRISIFVQEDLQEGVIKLSIEDNGIGMSSSELNQIFEPFYQGEGAKFKGTGLGLPLSRKIIEAHQGKIELKSRKGKGSCFTILLPLGNKQFSPDQLSIQDIRPNHSEELETMLAEQELVVDVIQEDRTINHGKVLVIEDNPNLRTFFQKTLSKEFDLTTAEDGTVGQAVALATLPDLIICDIKMPGLDGLTLTQNLKSDLRTAHIPIMLLTATQTLSQQIDGVKLGADDYMTKPFDLQLLKAKMISLINNRKALRQSYDNKLVKLSQETNFNKAQQQFLTQLQHEVELRYAQHDFKVSDLCESMGLSRSQLYRKVNHLLGQNISHYIQEVRLEAACRLLQDESLSIAEVAYRVGYSSPDYFSTAFKAKYQQAPTQFRKQTQQH